MDRLTLPRIECLILTHNLQSDRIKDEHPRSVGPQMLGRADLWESPTARYASHETSGPSGHKHGRESFGFAACSNAHLERDQSLVSQVQADGTDSADALLAGVHA